ncbi:MAG: TolC family protein [Fuerstiella sp.]
MKRFSKLLAAALASGCIGITPLSIAQDREVAPNEAATPKAQTLSWLPAPQPCTLQHTALKPVSGQLLLTSVSVAQETPSSGPPEVPIAGSPQTAAQQSSELDELDVAELLNGAQSEIDATLQINHGWWQPLVQRSLRNNATPNGITLQDVLVGALNNSHQIKVFSELPMIRASSITEADAAFDWSAFLDARWDDTSEPIGSSLTAGAGVERFEDQKFGTSVGLRKRTYSGGQLELSQRSGLEKNNSQFFLPNPQATSRVVVSFTQPLMRGKGKVYNTGLTMLACIDKDIAEDELHRQLQTHLLEVTRSYWALYLERGVLIQKMNSYRRAKLIVSRLEQRRMIDASESQIASAVAELKSRSADLLRADMAVRNAESRLRSLVNDPALSLGEHTELIPTDIPSFVAFPIDMAGSVGEAVQYRPEVAQSVKQIRSACVRAEMSRNELLPVLNLVTEAYVSGIDRNYDAVGAFGRSFDRGAPSYSVGLQYEVPLENRAARARHIRRFQELRQAQNQYQTTLETVRLEVEVAVREVLTSQQELFAKEQAMDARNRQLEYLTQRWEKLPGQDLSASLALENLLNAQTQLGQAEYDFLQSQMTYNLSLTNLKKSTGTLLQHESVSLSDTCVGKLPTRIASKPNLGPQ